MSERSLLVISVVVVAILLVLAFSSMMFWGFGYGAMGPGMMWQWWGGGFWWMPLMMIIFWALVALGIYLLVRSTMPRRREVLREGEDRALAIARERLAQGEITQEEFERIKKSLTE